MIIIIIVIVIIMFRETPRELVHALTSRFVF